MHFEHGRQTVGGELRSRKIMQRIAFNENIFHGSAKCQSQNGLPVVFTRRRPLHGTLFDKLRHTHAPALDFRQIRRCAKTRSQFDLLLVFDRNADNLTHTEEGHERGWNGERFFHGHQAERKDHFILVSDGLAILAIIAMRQGMLKNERLDVCTRCRNLRRNATSTRHPPIGLPARQHLDLEAAVMHLTIKTSGKKRRPPRFLLRHDGCGKSSQRNLEEGAAGERHVGVIGDMTITRQ